MFNINSSANVCICLLCVSVFGYFKEDILRTLVTMLTELVLKKMYNSDSFRRPLWRRDLLGRDISHSLMLGNIATFSVRS